MKISKAFIAVVLSAQAVNCYNVNNERVFKDTIEKVRVQPVPVTDAPTTHYGPPNYWFNSNIHTFGNTGFFGGFHAAMAPLATLLIDEIAYEGENVRIKIAKNLRRLINKSEAKIVDMCCGVGMSTRALCKAFHDADSVAALDTSPEMIAMANFLISDNPIAKAMTNGESGSIPSCNVSYNIGNAEKTEFATGSVDLVTIMYAFHEAPYTGRDRMLREARRILSPGSKLAVIDISPAYTPSPTMLAGEPYVLEYQKHIQDQLKSVQGFKNLKYTEVVEGHVGFWLLTRKG